MEIQPRDSFLIDGEWCAPLDGTTKVAVSPADEQPLASVPVAGVKDIERAVSAARASFERGEWSTASVEQRADALQRVLDYCRDHVEEIAVSAALELGQPIAQTRARTNVGLGVFAHAIESGLALQTQELRLDDETGKYALISRHPVGVVAAVAAFNAPFSFAVSKSIRALMAGCSVVLKPAVEGCLQTFVLADAFEAAGLPRGVINMAPGDGIAGEHLVCHPHVDLVTFTGSTAAGRRIAASCGENLKRSVLELGGKSAAVVLDDVELDAALPWLVGGAFGNAGQVCIALTRLLAPRSRYDEVVERLARAAQGLQPGPPLDPTSTLGALVSARQHERVSERVAEAVSAGAQLVCGGGRPPGSDRGWFFEATVLADVTNDMPIAREEVFGPVVVVIPHDGDDDAVALANDSPYGLHGAVFSADSVRAVEVASRLRTGTAAVNGYGILASAPFGGVKCSGWGREGGPESIAEFTELHTLTLDAATAAAWQEHEAASMKA